MNIDIFYTGKNLLFQKPVVSEFGLFYSICWFICQKFGLFFETTGFETTGFSPYILLLVLVLVSVLISVLVLLVVLLVLVLVLVLLVLVLVLV